MGKCIKLEGDRLGYTYKVLGFKRGRVAGLGASRHTIRAISEDGAPRGLARHELLERRGNGGTSYKEVTCPTSSQHAAALREAADEGRPGAPSDRRVDRREEDALRNMRYNWATTTTTGRRRSRGPIGRAFDRVRESFRSRRSGRNVGVTFAGMPGDDPTYQHQLRQLDEPGKQRQKDRLAKHWDQGLISGVLGGGAPKTRKGRRRRKIGRKTRARTMVRRTTRRRRRTRRKRRGRKTRAHRRRR